MMRLTGWSSLVIEQVTVGVAGLEGDRAGVERAAVAVGAGPGASAVAREVELAEGVGAGRDRRVAAV